MIIILIKATSYAVEILVGEISKYYIMNEFGWVSTGDTYNDNKLLTAGQNRKWALVKKLFSVSVSVN